MRDKKLFGAVEISLIIGIVILLVAGVTYAGLSGVVTIPGVPLILNSELISPSPTVRIALTSSPSPSPTVTGEPSPASTGTVSPLAVSANPSVSPTLSPSPSSTLSPSISPAASPTSSAKVSLSPSPVSTASKVTTPAPSPTKLSSPSLSPSPVKSTPTPSPTLSSVELTKQQDDARIADVNAIKAALDIYYKDNKSLPVSKTFSASWTYLPTSPLQILVGKYLDSLPVDPVTPSHKYGYKSPDGKTALITARLADTTRSEGAYDDAGNYLYTVKSP